jgi:hypothetical protein
MSVSILQKCSYSLSEYRQNHLKWLDPYVFKTFAYECKSIRGAIG